MMNAYMVYSMSFYEFHTNFKVTDALILDCRFNEAIAWFKARYGAVVGDTVIVSGVIRRAKALCISLSLQDVHNIFMDHSEEFRTRSQDFRLEGLAS